jgi:hypothetical protein
LPVWSRVRPIHPREKEGTKKKEGTKAGRQAGGGRQTDQQRTSGTPTTCSPWRVGSNGSDQGRIGSKVGSQVRLRTGGPVKWLLTRSRATSDPGSKLPGPRSASCSSSSSLWSLRPSLQGSFRSEELYHLGSECCRDTSSMCLAFRIACTANRPVHAGRSVDPQAMRGLRRRTSRRASRRGERAHLAADSVQRRQLGLGEL